MKKSGISSSKVYLILDRLIEKGLVSFVVYETAKQFQATPPQALLDYVKIRKEELDHVENEIQELIPQLSSFLEGAEEESAQVYKGLKGIKAAYDRLLDEFKKGEEYYFFAINPEEVIDEKVVNFLSNFHQKRIAKGVRVKAIADLPIKKLYEKKNVLGKLSSLRYYPLTLPTGIAIGKNRIIIMILGKENIAYELVSKRIAQRYTTFFHKVWKKSS